MKKYTIEITEEQKNKLVIFLIQYLPKVEDAISIYQELEKEYPDKPNMRKNKEYYKVMLKVLEELKEKLDNIPF